MHIVWGAWWCMRRMRSLSRRILPWNIHLGGDLVKSWPPLLMKIVDPKKSTVCIVWKQQLFIWNDPPELRAPTWKILEGVYNGNYDNAEHDYICRATLLNWPSRDSDSLDPPWIGRSQQAASLDDVRWLGPEFTLLFLYGSDTHICLCKANDKQSVWYSNSNLAIWGLFVDYLKLCCCRGLSMIIAIPRTDTCDDNIDDSIDDN